MPIISIKPGRSSEFRLVTKVTNNNVVEELQDKHDNNRIVAFMAIPALQSFVQTAGYIKALT